MCDTVVAMGQVTVDGSVVFGKNSDREPNEAHEVVLVPAADHPDGARLRATYLDIAQAPHTHAVLLAKPYWIWGAEMGVNEHGVAIGNEAVFTKVPHEKRDGLIGMDLLRLGLERARTSAEAVRVIGGLLVEHGQGGQCGHTHDLRYDNSFIVADATEAWVLETVGREWVARRADRFASISNALTIGTEWDEASPGLVDDARRRRLLPADGRLDVAEAYSDWLYTRFSDSSARRCTTEAALAAAAGHIGVRDVMALLRDHGDAGAEPGWTPARRLMGQTVCAHAGFGPVRVSQSVGSLVAELRTDAPPTAWVTATSAPCTSVFKPVWFDGGLPDLGAAPTGTTDPGSLWWRHEELHRATLAAYPDRLATYAPDRDLLEQDFLLRAVKAAAGTAGDRAELTAACFAEAAAAEEAWLARARAVPAQRPSLAYAAAWRRFDRAGGRS